MFSWRSFPQILDIIKSLLDLQVRAFQKAKHAISFMSRLDLVIVVVVVAVFGFANGVEYFTGVLFV